MNQSDIEYIDKIALIALQLLIKSMITMRKHMQTRHMQLPTEC